MNKEIKSLLDRIYECADEVTSAAEQYGKRSAQHTLRLAVLSDAAKAYETACVAANREPYATYIGDALKGRVLDLIMRIHPSITTERVMETLENAGLDNPGFCLACGEDAEGCEPDAERCECECCDKRAVFGAENVLLMLC